MKFKMIQYLRAPRPHKSGIDDLSLFEQAVNVMNGPVILFQMLRILDLHPLRALFRSAMFCWVMEASVLFTVCHRSFGGTAIAGARQVNLIAEWWFSVHIIIGANNFGQRMRQLVYGRFYLIYGYLVFNICYLVNTYFRVAYIKGHMIILSVGEEKFVNLLMLISISVSLVFTAGYVVEHWYYGFECMPWYYYFKTLKPSVEGYSFFDNVISRACGISNLVELIFFLVIIRELLKHQNRISNFIAPSAATRGGRRNAITAMGHFISWLLECLVFGVCQSLVQSLNTSNTTLGNYDWVFVMLIPSINYFVFPTAQVFTSPELRSNTFSTECFNCYACTCADGDLEGEGPLPTPGAIQMQHVVNGGILHI